MTEQLSQEEVYRESERAIQLENQLRLHEALWTGALYPTEDIVREYREILKILDSLLPYATDSRLVKTYIAKMKRKLKKYGVEG